MHVAPPTQKARDVKLKTRSRMCVAAAAAVALTGMMTACGSDDNKSSSNGGTGGTANGFDNGSASGIECGGKKALKASGSTAQANAMTRFVTAYETLCEGYTLNYTSKVPAPASPNSSVAKPIRRLRLTAERGEG